ncbi:MAG: hypothetical protein ACFFAK_09455 [Promethearchaeota archaeon]
MARNKYNKTVLYLLLIIFTISFFGNLKLSKAWEQKTIPGFQVLAINIPNCRGGITLDIEYQVLSGPGGIEAYLVEGTYIIITGKPTSYLLYEHDSLGDHWTYEVPSDNDYCVQFFNDYGGDITLRYQIEKKSILDLLSIIGISVSLGGLAVGGIVAFIVVRRKKKKRTLESIKKES